MTLFAVGYFGADSLITVLLTDTYRATLGQAAVVLSAAPLAWALTSLTVITAEAFGGLLGRAAGGAMSSGTTDLTVTYLVFAAALVLAVFAATRASTTQQAAVTDNHRSEVTHAITRAVRAGIRARPGCPAGW